MRWGFGTSSSAASAFLTVPSSAGCWRTFNVQLHHLTPTAFLTLSKFCWACASYGVEPDVDTFCTYYELQKQPKKRKEMRDGKEVEVVC